jgi:broad specificity phosphatase PhoE
VRLVLARHGRTASNVSRALDSRPPGAPLDETGLAQAAELGERLAGDPVSAVYASRATRAQQMAAPVAAAHDLTVQVIDGVQEVSCGDLEGRTDMAAREQFDRISGDVTGGGSAH